MKSFYYLLLLMSVFLTACSGTTEDSDDNGSEGISLTISSTNIAQGEPKSLTVQTRDADGNAVSMSVTLTTEYDKVTLSRSTVNTDTTGQAVVLVSYQENGTDVIKASATHDSVDYAKYLTVTVGQSSDQPSTSSDYDLSLNFSSDNKTVSNASPLSIVATLLDKDEQPVEDALIQFQSTLAEFSVGNAQVLTDENGNAAITMQAGETTGADMVIASYIDPVTVGTDSPTILAKAQSTFTVVEEITETTTHAILMSDVALDLTSLSYGGATSASVSFYEDTNDNGTVDVGTDTLYTNPQTVKFSSQCALASKSNIDTEVATINGQATSSYQALDCEGGDTIQATVTINEVVYTKSATLTIASAELGSIMFDSVSPQSIYLLGSGGETTSEVTFKVLNAFGYPMSNQNVKFELSSDAGGLALSLAQASTNSEGYVSTRVMAGTVPVPVKVYATVLDESDQETEVKTQSSQLNLAVGIADAAHFSLQGSDINIEGLSYDNEEVTFTTKLADFYGNPVLDGTLVSFSTNSGVIGDQETNQASCETVSGECEITWLSQSPRPDDGRVVVLAMTTGSESFVDANGNGTYDTGETFTDTSEPYWDLNNNGQWDAGEQYWDLDEDSTWDAGNNLYDGQFCEAGATCGSKSATLFVTDTLILSGSSAQITSSSSALKNAGEDLEGATNLDGLSLIFDEGVKNFEVSLLDENGNPLPSGTTVAVVVESNNLSIVSGFDEDGNIIRSSYVGVSLTSSSNYTVASAESAESITVSISKLYNGFGSVTITTKTPNGISSTAIVDIKREDQIQPKILSRIVNGSDEEVINLSNGTTYQLELQVVSEDNESIVLENQLLEISLSEEAKDIAVLGAYQALTDDTGTVTVDLTTLNQSGIGKVNVSLEFVNENLVKEQIFQVLPPHDIVMSPLQVGGSETPSELSYASTTSVAAFLFNDVNDNGSYDAGTDTAYDESVAVIFSSDCVSSNKSSIDTPVDSLNGLATATYEAETCESDTITATAQIGSQILTQSIDIDIASPDYGAIEFVQADPKQIFIQGAGGVSTSEVTFKVTNEYGFAAANAKVKFALNTLVGGVALVGADDNDFAYGVTNASGEVSARVSSGKVATPVRVIAEVLDDSDAATGIKTESSQLVLAIGIPDQQHFSLNVSSRNPEAWSVAGEEVTVTARLGDYYGNPVMDGTQVNFVTESGLIEESCLTDGGACSVTWTSTHETNKPVDHRNTIMAYALGNEFFHDANGDGQFSIDDGEAWDNKNSSGLSSFYAQTSESGRQLIAVNQVFDEPFVDSNQNGLMDEPFDDANSNNQYNFGESFIDLNGDGFYSGQGDVPAGETTFLDWNADNLYNGSGIHLSESYLDLNLNGDYDSGEPFTDRTDISSAVADQRDDGLLEVNSVDYSGAEVFTDFTGLTDGQFDGPGFVDLSEPWLDANEDGIRSENEIFVDFNNDNQFTLRNGLYDGFACEEGTVTVCGDASSYVRRALPIVMASSTPDITIRITSISGSVSSGGSNCSSGDIVLSTRDDGLEACSRPELSNASSVSFEVYVADTADQTMPSGTTISIGSDVGEISGTTSLTVGDTANDNGETIGITISDADSTIDEADVGQFEVTVTTTKDYETIKAFVLTVN